MYSRKVTSRTFEVVPLFHPQAGSGPQSFFEITLGPLMAALSLRNGHGSTCGTSFKSLSLSVKRILLLTETRVFTYFYTRRIRNVTKICVT